MNWQNKQERAQFLAAFTALSEMHGKAFSDNMKKFYFSCFEKFDIAVVVEAMRKATMSLKFFPKPVELVELIEGTKEDVTVTAELWADRVLETASKHGRNANPQFSDPVVNAVIKNRFGSWGAVCNSPIKDRIWFEKKFVKSYVEYAERGIELHEPVKGLGGTTQPIMIGESGQALKAIPSGSQEKLKGLVSNLAAQKAVGNV